MAKKSTVRVLGIVSVCIVLLVAGCIGYSVWSVSLPTDSTAISFFQVHRAELDALVAAVQQTPTIEFINAKEARDNHGVTVTPPIQTTALLKAVGAQSLRQSGSEITVCIWGTGCAICSDSYAGYIHVSPTDPAPKDAAGVRSLEDKGLPRDQNGRVLDGLYILPLADGWYIFRHDLD